MRLTPLAPIFYASGCTTSTGEFRPLSTFSSARVSFHPPAGGWKYRYDQAGLVLSFRRAAGSSVAVGAGSIPPKWIKAGVEFYLGAPQLSTVACDSWADWSVAPLPEAQGEGEITLLVERETSASGTSLWVYYVYPGGEARKLPLREICWPFAEGGGTGEGWEVAVGRYLARPEKNVLEGELLEVDFTGFKVSWD